MRKILLLLLAMATPLTAQAADEGRRPEYGPLTVMVPENYPAFDPIMRDSHPEAIEIFAIVLHREILDIATREPSTVVLLNPAHVDAETLREALVYAHNFRARGSPADASGFSIVGARRRPVPRAMRRELEPRLRELMRQQVEDFGHYGEGRRIVLENPSAIVRIGLEGNGR